MLNRKSELGINAVYAEMLAERKQKLDEAISNKNSIHEETEKLIYSNGLSIIHKTLVKQSVRHDYFRIMIAGSHAMNKKEMTLDELAIRNDKEQYTEEFTALLKDYYLHL